jgi:hypothetical protein
MTKKAPPPPARTAKPVSTRARTQEVLAKVEVIEPLREARARALLGEIRQLMVRSTGNAWDLGHALSTFLRDKAYASLGYRSFDACLAGEGLLSRTQAYKLIRVAEHFSREELAILSNTDKAQALVTYAEATPARDSAAGLLRQDAIVSGVRVSKASVVAVERATIDVRAKSKPSAKATPQDAARIAKAKRDVARTRWLAARLKTLGLGKAKVTPKGQKVLVEVDGDVLDALIARARSPRAR